MPRFIADGSYARKAEGCGILDFFGVLESLAHEDGYCVIVVTHDLSIADKADEVLKLKDGCLMQEYGCSTKK